MMLQLLSAPFTGRPWLFPAFRCPASHQPSLRLAFLPERRDVGFTMFRSNSGDDLAPAYYTGSRFESVCPQAEDGPLGCVPFWLEPVSVYHLFLRCRLCALLLPRWRLLARGYT